MLNINLINKYLEKENELKELERYLREKESLEYFTWYKEEVNKSNRSSKEKIIDTLRNGEGNEAWANKESEKLSVDIEVKQLKMVVTLLREVFNKNGVDLDLFNNYQRELLESIGYEF